jgi:hypothetical protein
METVRFAVLLLFGPMAVLFWVFVVWFAVIIRRERRRGIEPAKLQVEGAAWAVAIAAGFTAFALLGLLL